MRIHRASWRAMAIAAALFAAAVRAGAAQSASSDQVFQYDDTRALVALVNDASALLQKDGEAAFAELRSPGSRWCQDDSYVFVLDRDGNMLVHPDSTMEGKNQLGLKDVGGKPIIHGLIDAATVPGKAGGWYHYQWPVPGGLLPRWKSSYVRLVTVPSGKSYIVGSGVYNDRMERPFVVDAVDTAAAEIERRGDGAFPLLRDATGPFIAKDAYVFVMDADGVELVNPAFPNLEGRHLADLRDTEGKPLIREMLRVADTSGTGWVDYMWPKPGDSVSTQKSTYVRKVTVGSKAFVVGCGVYLADAPKATAASKMSAPELMQLVREGAAEMAERGDAAYEEFRQPGSKWFRDDTYFFAWTLDGVRSFHAADPAIEGQDAAGAADIIGRPYGRMMLAAASTPTGEGWVHYMYPEPGGIFPVWKSAFVKRVTLPSGATRLIGCGIYNMQMDRAFIEDVVDRAATLVAAHGPDAFAQLRDKKGEYVFMDTYVFVNRPDGVEVVNGGQPSLEGTNLIDVTDVNGKKVAAEYIDTAMRHGSGWVEYYWYKPGQNTPAPKQTYVRKVQHGSETFIVGSGFYPEAEPTTTTDR